jgi:hypothetical protein
MLLDFFLWGHLKDLVYQEPIRDFHQLQQRIRQCCDAIQSDVLLRVHADLQKRLAVCLAQEGQHIQHVL